MVEKASFFLAILTILFILLFPNMIYAGQDTWTGDSSDNWNEPGNWQDNSVPDSTDSVTIPTKLKNFPDISGNAYCMRIRILGTCKMKASATLNITGGGEVIVEAGGTFQATGDTSGYATVTRYGGSGSYKFEVQSSGTIGANTTIFEYMDTNGVELESGAKIDTMLAFKNCIFRHGAEDGVLFTINADLSGASDTLLIEDCRFDSVCSGSLSNNVYRDSTSTGYIYFVSDSGGNFWGEDYDDDEGDLVVWNLKPVAIITYPADGDSFASGEFITFWGDSSYDPDGEIISFKWYFGDGDSSSDTVTTHCYNDTGKLEVTFIVEDSLCSETQTKINIFLSPDTIHSGYLITDLDLNGYQEIVFIKYILDPGLGEFLLYLTVDKDTTAGVSSILIDTCGNSGNYPGKAASGDIDLDGDLEIIVAYCAGISAYNWDPATDSLSLVWNHEHPTDTFDLWNMKRSPIICDLDYADSTGDRNPEIIFTPGHSGEVFSPSHEMKVLDHLGNLEDSFTASSAADFVWGQPSIADIDQDGKLEIISLMKYGPPNYYLQIFNNYLDTLNKYQFPCSQAGADWFTAPTIGDIDYLNDSSGLEAVCPLKCGSYRYTAVNISIDTSMTALWTYNFSYPSIFPRINHSASFARDFSKSDSGYYNLYTFGSCGGNVSTSGNIARISPTGSGSETAHFGPSTGISIANMDGDKDVEITCGRKFGTRIYDFNLSLEDSFSINDYYQIPAIGDWDGDSIVDIHWPHRTGTDDEIIHTEPFATPYSDSIGINTEWSQAYHDERNTSLYAQPFGGNLSHNAVWWGNYIIYKDLKIATGCTLYIEAGTQIWVLPPSIDTVEVADLSTNYGLDSLLVDIVVVGAIKVCGAEHRKVRFTSLSPNPTYCDWGGIQFEKHGDKGFLKHAIIENAKIGVNISTHDCELEITNCEIRNCKLYGIKSEKLCALPTCNLVKIDSTYIHTIDTIFPPNGGNAIRLVNSSNVEITNCTFENIWMYSVYLDSTTDVVISSNYIDRELIPGITAVVFNYNSSPSSTGDGDFSYNYIKGKQCIKTYNSSSPRIENCLLENPWSIDASYLVWVSGSDCKPILRSDTLKGNYNYGIYAPYADSADFGLASDSGFNVFQDTAGTSYIYKENSPNIQAIGNYWPGDSSHIASLVNNTDFWPISGLAPGYKILAFNKKDLKPSFQLKNNYPNPFNNNMSIVYCLPEALTVNHKIFDITGRIIYSKTIQNQNEGHHTFIWNGLDNQGKTLPSGIYIYEINAGEYDGRRKLLLIK